MIDEKKREEAANKYASSSWIDDEYPGEIQEAFNGGIYWLLDNLWHDASEEPKDKSAILLRYTGSMCKWASLDEVDADDWKQTVKELGITRWLYIDDLFPKEGGVQ